MERERDAKRLAELLLASAGSPVPEPPLRAQPHTRQLERLLGAFRGRPRSVIVLHDHPDPDAIGAGLALAALLKDRLDEEPPLVHGGVIARAENRALVEELGVVLVRAADFDWSAAGPVALVDCQPATGNHALPAGLVPALVLDHHPPIGEVDPSTLADIRPSYGATCTIMTEYLEDAQVRVDERLATALFYGIKTDTQDLGRQASGIDALAYLRLFVSADKRALARIQNPRLPRSYYQALHRALEQAQIYGDVAVVLLGELEMPETTGETADLLVRLQGIRWALCVGAYEAKVLFSVRTTSARGDAGALAVQLAEGYGAAGGHWRLAGGALPLHDDQPASRRALERHLVRTFLRLLGVGTTAEPLLGKG